MKGFEITEIDVHNAYMKHFNQFVDIDTCDEILTKLDADEADQAAAFDGDIHAATLRAEQNIADQIRRLNDNP
jgi:hypothetical protein